MTVATATAHPNIALVKYWGKRDLALNLPAVPSLSLTLDRFQTRTTVVWGAEADSVELDGERASEHAAGRVLAFLDLLDLQRPPCQVTSRSNFPVAAGLASSSSAFAALALAASAAAGRDTDPTVLSRLARRGSGSACRSLWGGFVEWPRGERADGADSHGRPLAPPDHWDVTMVVAIVSGARKPVGSTEAMERARRTSPYYDTWVRTASEDVGEARAAVLARDLARLGKVMEASTHKMHATLHTARPPLLYQAPATIACLHAVQGLRDRGTSAWATMDAGPNVKVLCHRSDADEVAASLSRHAEHVEVLGPGGDPILEAG
jgi:diphosphomevalonate decarboxylase